MFDEPSQEAEVGKVYGTRRFPEHLQITVVRIRSLRHILSQLAIHDGFDRPRTGSRISQWTERPPDRISTPARGIASDGSGLVVAGAGFEPATSGL